MSDFRDGIVRAPDISGLADISDNIIKATAKRDQHRKRTAKATQKTAEELERVIGAMDPDQVADADYVDAETGEIVLEKGKKARTSGFNPGYEEDQVARFERSAAKRAEEDELWRQEDEALLDAEEFEGALEWSSLDVSDSETALVEFWYDDGGLFGGHTVVIELDAELKYRDAYLAG